MPKCYQLVGVPGSGKSTWVEVRLGTALDGMVLAKTSSVSN